MGCKLPKLKRLEENSPGKIYSTLKRPQVETKVGMAYTYRFLDFILGKDDGTSMLCISSVRELPAQMLDLYRQGFVLAAVHPFVQPLGIEPTTARRLLYRAVLVRLSESGDKSETKCGNHLEMEMCLSADQVPSTELIQGYLKKIQDAAEQGIMFVGFVQQPSRALCALGQADPDEISLSLHSSPSSIQGDKVDQSVDARQQSPSEESHLQAKGSACELAEVVQEDGEVQAGDRAEGHGESTPSSPSDATSPAHVGSPEVTAGDILAGNNNKAAVQEAKKEEQNSPAAPSNGLELFALFNRPGTGPSLLKYYTVKVPLRVQFRDEGVTSVEASWLDHMTQHFNSGASLVDGYFHLGHDNDSSPRSVDSIFIFQEGQDVDSSTSPAYDAIVVEQWTVIQGVSVKTDYIPLLQSLAMYGWRLTCVLPTPVVKTNSDGSLATKQIVFLQRPVLPRKKKEPKRLNFKTRSKSNKNSVKDAPKDRRQKSDSPGTETEEQKALEGEDSSCRGETDGADRKRGSGGGRAPDTEEGHQEDQREVENGERGEGGAKEDYHEEEREGSETAVGRGGEVEPEEAGEHREPKLATAGVTDRDAVAETMENESEAGQQRLAGAQDDVGKDQGQQQEGESGNGRRPPASGHGGRERSGGDGGDAEIVVQVSMETARVQEALSS